MTDNVICIGDWRVGPGERPLIVAELSGNHNQSLERALALVRAAQAAGVNAIKLQTYTADTLTIDCNTPAFRITDPNSLWHGKTLYELYQGAHTPWEWHHALFKLCRELNLMAFSTPFDEGAVDFLEQFDLPCYKIASFEMIDTPLLAKVASTGRPIIMSTGMASEDEITEALQTIRSAGGNQVILLKCTSAYPAPPESMNLATLPVMAQRFAVPVGLSDHTLGTTVATAAVALGACLIEKHFTLSRSDGGPDAAFSLEPAELRQLVKEVDIAWRAVGTVHFGRGAAESANLVFRRSLFAVKDIAVGEAFTLENVRRIRPGFGLAPRYIDAVLGKRASRAIARGTPLTWNLVEEDEHG